MKKPPQRLIRLVRPPTPVEPGIFCLTIGPSTTFYVFQEIPCEVGGRGFALHRLGLGDLYHVRIGRGEDCSCECLGFLRHGHCKHIAGLLALEDRGLLGEAACAKPQAAGEAYHLGASKS